MKRLIIIFLLLLTGIGFISCDTDDNFDIEKEALNLLDDIPNEVTKNLYFTKKIFSNKNEEIIVKWETSDVNIIDTLGVVYRTSNDTKVTITVKLYYQENITSKSKEVVVKGDSSVIKPNLEVNQLEYYINSNKSFTLDITINNNSQDDLEFIYDKEYLSQDNLTFTALKVGECIIKVVLGNESVTVKVIISDNFKKIAAILNMPTATYTTRGFVVSKFDRGFLIYDYDNYILVYKGKVWDHDVNIGDSLEVTGLTTKYGNSIQFGNETTYKKTGYVDYYESEYKEINDNLVSNIENKMQVTPVVLEGILTINDGYYNIDINMSRGVSLSYPDTSLGLDLLNNKKIKVYGYLTSINNYYLNVNVVKVEGVSHEETFDLHILSVNDTHGYCLQDENGKNGISNISYMINSIRNKNPLDDCVLIANGDMFQGTALSNITYGKVIIDAMNVMKFDCMVIGNHEFDWGLETILQYFDGNLENGEANFPLLNANIYNVSDNKLVSIENGNVFESIVLAKEDIKVGVIGYIGNVYNSISYTARKDYYFDNDISSSVLKIGSHLKDNGCDVIVVSIHGGDASGVENYYNNESLSKLTYKDGYLVDAVINGHTHTKQAGLIRRNGVYMPAIQAGCNSNALGDITLKINMSTKKISSASTTLYNSYEIDNKYDEEVEEVIDKNYTDYESILKEKYCLSLETINNKSKLYNWIASCMMAGTNSDIGICNTGGVRSNGNITKGEYITIENMYMINPFDNKLVIVDVKGEDIKSFLNNSYVFYMINNSYIEDEKLYRVCVIDYVYYWDNFPRNDNAYFTDIILRDLLIMDLKARETFNPSTSFASKLNNVINLNLYFYEYNIKKKEYNWLEI